MSVNILFLKISKAPFSTTNYSNSTGIIFMPSDPLIPSPPYKPPTYFCRQQMRLSVPEKPFQVLNQKDCFFGIILPVVMS